MTNLNKHHVHFPTSTEHRMRATYVVVFLLDELEEGRHVRTSEVVDSLQAREHGPVREPLEVVLANVL